MLIGVWTMIQIPIGNTHQLKISAAPLKPKAFQEVARDAQD